ncbi:4-diphosphocytidyl-2-C-methyl-D-erythritolkinase [Striga asiatica]|uniref:4-diphosphocytidyl-2-C-methyl-D-erythritolkinase n=1 Tax=Striga asiatica TaxID=4170 RepID=A0A5A7RJL8_STRAF|nr:4-diphosphocytidyl-2-C-methyl-D-erythritolkinase [Striga asiatica]
MKSKLGEAQIATHLQLITSQSEPNFPTEQLTKTPSTQDPTLPTSNITVLSPFPITKIFLPIPTSRHGGKTRWVDILLTAIHSRTSSCHIISLKPDTWSKTYNLPSITTAGPRQPDATSSSPCCQIPLEGS